MTLVGPLGWPYPVLNLFIDLVNKMKREKRGSRLKQGQFSPSEPIMRNLEEVTWTDWKGRERKMRIHREVR